METYTEHQKEIVATLRKNNQRPIINVEEGLGKARERATAEVVRKSDDVVVYEGSAQQCADYMYRHKGEGIFFRSKLRRQ